VKKKFIKNSYSYSKILSVSILALFIVMYALSSLVYLTISAEAVDLSSRDTTVTFYPFQDAYVNEDDPDVNFGSLTYLWVTQAPNKRMYIQFDFSSIPPGSVITSATLQLYQYNYEGSGDRIYDIYLVNNSWNEDTITWNSLLGTTSGDVLTSSTIVNTSEGWKSWDVTFDVNACVNNISLPDHPYHGWMIKDHYENTSDYQGRQFASRDIPPEIQEFMPKLGVTYEFNTEPVVYNENPVNGISNVERPPIELNATVEDPEGDIMDVSIRWMKHDYYHYGEWILLEDYKGVYNGTYNKENLTGNDWIWGNTVYTWSINVTDGTSWTNKTFQYTTSGSRYDIDNDDSVNFQDAGLVWIYRTSEVPYDGIYDVNCDGQVNFQDAGLTWINRD